MILLDTNVASEAIKPSPHPSVSAWLDQQAAQTLYLCSVSQAELLFGIGIMPDGKRKNALTHAVDDLFELYDGRILAFDPPAARRYAELAVRARALGKGFPTPDGYIAAIAASRGFAVATRDTSAFEAAGVTVIDPWAFSG